MLGASKKEGKQALERNNILVDRDGNVMTTILILVAGGLMAAVVMFLLFVRAAGERNEAMESK